MGEHENSVHSHQSCQFSTNVKKFCDGALLDVKTKRDKGRAWLFRENESIIKCFKRNKSIQIFLLEKKGTIFKCVIVEILGATYWLNFGFLINYSFQRVVITCYSSQESRRCLLF